MPIGELQRLSERLTTVPENFTLHSRVKKIIDDRRQMGEGKLPVDWGMAENLAYASLLVSGYGAVSYTHLDVYKRQPCTPSPIRWMDCTRKPGTRRCRCGARRIAPVPGPN